MTDTNTAAAVTQVAQTIPQLVSLIASLFSALAIIVASVGRIIHAQKTGNSAVSAIVSGTNSPAETVPPAAQPVTPPAGSLAGTLITPAKPL